MAGSEHTRRRWARAATGAAAAALLAVACADVSDDPAAQPAATATAPQAPVTAPNGTQRSSGAAEPVDAPRPSATPSAGAAMTEPEESATMIAPGLQRIVDRAVTDLAARTGVPAADITVVSAETVTWSDASLGCPQPGRSYAQVPQDGAKVHLRAGGRLFRYHTGGQRTEPFLCEQPARQPGAPRVDPGRRTYDPRLRPPGER